MTNGGWPACFAPLAPLAFGEGQGPDDGGARCARWLGGEERRGRGGVSGSPCEREVAQSRRARDSRELANDSSGSSKRFLASARTWLLSIGWRRHGLIDPGELPRGSPA